MEKFIFCCPSSSSSLADDGGFNELLSCNDKLGGNPLNPRRVQMFKDCLDSCGMVDLGFHGPKFTWVNKSEVGHFIQERLNRGFANID